jgi:parallel beta-helix repeat protein
VGNRIAHNLVHDAPHTAVLLHGNDHRVEYNDIHHVCMETADAGAFYMGRDFTERGNVVQYNYFHDFPGGDMQAIYLDDFASGTTVLGNICYRTGRGVLIGGGRDNVVENNVFVECNPAVWVDARGMTWAGKMFNGQDQTLIVRLNAVNFSSPPYSERYPELAGILENQPAVPKGNRIEKNIAFGGPWLELRRPLVDTVVEIRNNLTDGDPRFVDLHKGDFRLRNDSPAFRLGFQPIPMEMIGPRSGRQYIDVFMMRASPARALNHPD